MSIVINTPNGSIGRRLAQKLLAAGKSLTLISRNPERVADLVPLPMVATADIAEKAAEVLLDAAWTGHRYLGVHGPADVTYNEVVEIVSRETERPVRYVEVTLEQARKGMLDAGMPPFLVDIYAEMYAAVPDGRMDAAEPRSKDTTTPTTLAQFTREVIKPVVAEVRS